MSFRPVETDSAGDEIVAEINVTPLTDLFLVLLIIFMVTSTALVQQGTSVQLPRASSGQTATGGVVVTATADGQLQVEGKAVSWADLPAALRNELSRGTSQPTVVLQGDRNIVLERAIQILTIARQAGAERVSIATVPENSGGR
ncbi:MAG: biopolymer transporter ExbD [candidate division KSB1 bacterium]|nr:biopolymer transporter ExbD [candidate division KSB1 bacterium]